MSVGTKFRQTNAWLRQRWLLLLGVIAALSLLLYRLTSLPVAGKLSRPEYILAADGGSWRVLLHDPFFLPYRLLSWLSRQAFGGHPTLALRLPSVLVAVLALLAITYTLRRWYGPRTAFFGFVIIATSAIFLHLGRSASVDIIYFAALPLLLLTHVALLRAPTIRSLAGWVLVATLLIYVPGLVWFVLLQIVWQHKLLAEAFLRIRRWTSRLLLITVTTVGIAPLLYGFAKHSSLSYALDWLGLPSALPSFSHMLKNLVAAINFIFFHTPEDPSHWLGKSPLLGALLLVCLISGLIFYAGHWRAERTRLLASLAGLSLLLLTAGGPVVRSIIVPLIYIIALGGLAYLLHYWLSLFPRNISARWLGIGIVCIVLSLTLTYNLRHYFVAWPHNSETRAAFTYPPPQP